MSNIERYYRTNFYQAVENVLAIGRSFPINTSGSLNVSFDCSCLVNDSTQALHPEIANWTSFNKTVCSVSVLTKKSVIYWKIDLFQQLNGTLTGPGCNTNPYVADVFLMSVLLFLGTFLISVQLKEFKNALFFPSKVGTTLKLT